MHCFDRVSVLHLSPSQDGSVPLSYQAVLGSAGGACPSAAALASACRGVLHLDLGGMPTLAWDSTAGGALLASGARVEATFGGVAAGRLRRVVSQAADRLRIEVVSHCSVLSCVLNNVFHFHLLLTFFLNIVEWISF
jgi:hypothetical protein